MAGNVAHILDSNHGKVSLPQFRGMFYLLNNIIDE